jgi:hypothetical protein
MLAFRSEEHVDRWREQRCVPEGAVFDPEQMCRVADAWYRERLAPDWKRKTAEEAQRLFDEVGLTGPFWRLQQ